MKHWLIALCFGCIITIPLSAQQLVPAVLASNGGTGIAADIQLDWTLGETAIGGLSGQQRNYTEGFHQPILLIEKVDYTGPETNKLNKDVPGSGITISPNPTNGHASARVRFGNRTMAHIYLYSTTGKSLKKIFDGTVEAGEKTFPLDLSDLPDQTFIFIVKTNEGMESAKVVKTR